MALFSGTTPPYMYNYKNAANGMVSPSTLHASNTAAAAFYRRYLLQKAISVFKWDVPEWWSKDYFLYTLYCYGVVAVLNTDKFGPIPQQCGLSGYDVFYQPNTALVTNPYFSGLKELKINTQCVLFKLMPDYGSLMDMISFYADQMALASETAMINLHNSKLSYVFAAENKAAAEGMKKMYDQISAGNPATFVGKNFFTDDGTPKWSTVFNNVGQNYIVTQIIDDLRKIEIMFDTDIGIPTANTDKKERLIVDEVNANNTETATKCQLWLDGWKDSCRRVKDMFGITVTVDWRVKPLSERGVEANADTAVTSGTL